MLVYNFFMKRLNMYFYLDHVICELKYLVGHNLISGHGLGWFATIYQIAMGLHPLVMAFSNLTPS
jgi:hypothetical protein